MRVVRKTIPVDYRLNSGGCKKSKARHQSICRNLCCLTVTVTLWASRRDLHNLWPIQEMPRRDSMPTITTKDGTQIYYKDWGKGQPIVFSHGWPLTADDWDGQMMYFGQRGYPALAHDRRGHGRSEQTWDGNEMDTYADDLAALTEKLDLKNAIHVGHSTGGGEVARYIGRHGSKRVAAAVLISAVPPLMVKTEKNPASAPIEVWTACEPRIWRIGRSFTWTSLCPFTATTRPAPSSPNALGPKS